MRRILFILFLTTTVLLSCNSSTISLLDKTGQTITKLRYTQRSGTITIDLPQAVRELGAGYFSITMDNPGSAVLLRNLDSDDVETWRSVIAPPLGIEAGQMLLEYEFPVDSPPAAIELVSVSTDSQGGNILPQIYSLAFYSESKGLSLMDYHMVLPVGFRYRQELQLPATLDQGQNGGRIFQEVQLGMVLEDFDYINAVPAIRLDYEYSVPPNGMPLEGYDHTAASNPDSDEIGSILEPLPPTAELAISDESGLKRREWELKLRPGENSVYFYPEQFGFDSEFLRFTHDSINGRLRGVSLVSIPRDRLSPDGANLQPLPADLGTIMDYSEGLWRNSDFELFSWSAYEKVLIFDFANYGVQADYLRRLAYFVEKEGYRGRLLNNRELQNLHGWNAHNYHPRDLSRFYNQARDEGMELNPEEIVLRDLLLARGILLDDQGVYREGEGQIISVTSHPGQSAASRALFLNHEALHGLFYNFSSLEESSENLWLSLGEDSREYMKLYFSYVGYDREDEYLMVNEFQAYMLQQNTRDIRWIVQNRMADRIARKFPEYRTFIYSNNEAVARNMLASAQSLQAIVYQNAGFVAGDLFELNRL